VAEMIPRLQNGFYGLRFGHPERPVITQVVNLVENATENPTTQRRVLQLGGSSERNHFQRKSWVTSGVAMRYDG